MQGALNVHCGRVRAAENLPRGPSRVLERGHGLADIVDCSISDFRPLWREHAPAAGERLHLPTLAAAGGAAVVVIAALALAATDPKAENVVLDMFAGV